MRTALALADVESVDARANVRDGRVTASVTLAERGGATLTLEASTFDEIAAFEDIVSTLRDELGRANLAYREALT